MQDLNTITLTIPHKHKPIQIQLHSKQTFIIDIHWSSHNTINKLTDILHMLQHKHLSTLKELLNYSLKKLTSCSCKSFILSSYRRTTWTNATKLFRILSIYKVSTPFTWRTRIVKIYFFTNKGEWSNVKCLFLYIVWLEKMS